MGEPFCFARVRFSALGGRYEKMLSRLSEQGIGVEKIKPQPGGVEACIRAKDYKTAARTARKYHTRLKVQKRQGLYFKLRKFRGRWGLLAAPLVFWLTIVLAGSMVWSVRWQGVEKNMQPVLKSALYSMDIYEGAFLSREKIRYCEKELVNRIPQLSWASLNFAKGRLVVEAVTNREKPEIEPNTPVSLLAAEDGLILSTRTEEGILMKKSGQTAAKGETLISAGRQDRDGRMIQTHAKGSVIAQVEKTYQCVQPLHFTEKLAIGRPESKMNLLFARGKMQLTGRNKTIPEESRRFCRPLIVCGFALPATIEEMVWIPYQEKTVVLGPNEAEERAKLACLTLLFSEFPDAKVQTQQVEIDRQNDCVSCVMKIVFTANIAKADA